MTDGEKEKELGELKKQLRSEKLGLFEGESKTELGGTTERTRPTDERSRNGRGAR